MGATETNLPDHPLGNKDNKLFLFFPGSAQKPGTFALPYSLISIPLTQLTCGEVMCLCREDDMS